MASQGQRFRRKALRRGYKVEEVDEFLDRVEATLASAPTGSPVSAQEVHDVVFRVRFGGYDEWQVDLHLDRVERQIAELEERRGAGARGPESRVPERIGPPAREERAGPPDRFGAPGQMGPPDRFGPPRGERVGPPDQMGPPDRFGPPRDERVGPPVAPPSRGMPAQAGPTDPYGRYEDPTGGFEGPRGGGYDAPRGPMAPTGPGPSGPAGAVPSGPPRPISGGPLGPTSGGPLGPPPGARPPGGYGPDERFNGFEAGRHGKADMTAEIRMSDRDPRPPARPPHGTPPPGPAPLGGDAQRVDQIRRTFQVRRFGSGYDPDQVDRLFEGILSGMSGRGPMPVNPAELDSMRFGLVPGGYFEAEVDAALREVKDILRRG